MSLKLSIAAVSLMALAGLSQPAQARHIGGAMGHGPVGSHVAIAPHVTRFSGFHGIAGPRRLAFNRFHHRRFHHRFAFVAVYPYNVYPYDYDDGCYWLKRRALVTGSHYWWRRYRECRYGYGY